MKLKAMKIAVANDGGWDIAIEYEQEPTDTLGIYTSETLYARDKETLQDIINRYF